MNYEELPPPPDLEWFVRCYWTLSAPAGEGPPEPALPDGCPELILNLADPFRAQVGANVVDQPVAMLVGQISRPLAIAPAGRVDLVAVRFRPFGASLVHPDMSTITDGWADVGAPDSPVGAIMPRLGAAVGTGARLALLGEMLTGIARGERRPDARVIAAVERIEATDGAVVVAELAREVGTTPRHLQRLFGDAVGISPKLLCRIRRFQRVFAAWRDDPGNWAEVAVRCGYFDQAHLVRDFSELGGAAPAGLIAALPEFTRLFTALNPSVQR